MKIKHKNSLLSPLMALCIGSSLLVGLGAGAASAGQPSPAQAVQNSSTATEYQRPCDVDPANVIKYFKDSAGTYPYAPVILGHRGLFGKYNETGGGSRNVPENSLASLQAASNACLEGAEMDIRASSDPDTPVIMHDSAVGRTTNVFDPRIVPSGETPPSADELAVMKTDILAAQGTNYPPAMDPIVKHDLESDFDARNAFSPYGEISETPTIHPLEGTTYGRNPLVKDLKPETLTNLRLLKYQDPAPHPSINHDGTFGPTPTAENISTEKIQTVQSLLAYAAEKKIKSAIVFDVIERDSLTAITKILAADNNTFVNGRKAKDVVVLKYRGNLAPDVEALLNELKQTSVSTQYPDGFYPNVIGIVAKYLDKPGGFNSANYVNKWISLRSEKPELPLVSIDTVVTSADQGSGRDLVAAEKAAGVAIGSFHDVPSYRGGDQYPQALVDKRLYFLSGGICCRSTDSTGDPKGTPDNRYDFFWMIAGSTTDAIPSGMITSDDPLPIIKKLEELGLRQKARNAYKSAPVGEFDGQFNQMFNIAATNTLGVGGHVLDSARADQENTNYRTNNIWAFEWVQGDVYKVKLLKKDEYGSEVYLTNKEGRVEVWSSSTASAAWQQWKVVRSPENNFISLYSQNTGYPGVLGFERDSWTEGTLATVGSEESLNSTRKWDIRSLDGAEALPLNPQQELKLINRYTDRLQVGITENQLLSANQGEPFTFRQNGDGSYKLSNSISGNVYSIGCLPVDGKDLYAGGGACTNWLILKVPGSAGRFTFFNLQTGRVMDFGDRTTEGRDIYQWESLGIYSQQFRLEPS